MATQAQIKQRCKEVVELAEELYGFSIAYNNIDIAFKSKGRAAAQAWWKGYAFQERSEWSYGLKFSTESASLDSNEMLNDTVPHEVAHLVCAWNPALGKNHDIGWKRVCIALGGTGARTHSQTLTKARYKSQYVYRTDSGEEVTVGPKIHKGIQTRNQTRRLIRTGESFGKSHFVRHITPDEHRREHMKKVTEYRAAAGAPAPASQKRPAPKKRKPTSHKRPAAAKAGSKAERALTIYHDIVGKGHGKEVCIQRFQDALDMTKAGATTYFYNCKKKAGY